MVKLRLSLLEFVIFLLMAAALGHAARAQSADGTAELRGHGGPVRAIAAFADGILTGGFDSTIIEWGLQPPRAKQVRRHHDSTVNAICPLGGSCFASAGEDGRIAIWCGKAAEPRQVIAAAQAPIAALALSPDGRTLASAGWDHMVRLWLRASTDEAAPFDGASRQIDGHVGPVNGVAFLNDGSAIVSVGYDGRLRLTPLHGGTPRLITLEAPLNAVVVLSTNEIVTAGADGRVRFFSLALEQLAAIELRQRPLTTLALSPDRRLLATAGLQTQATVIDAAKRAVVSEILGPGLPIWSLAFATDGSELFTGGADRAVRRFNALTGKPAGQEIAKAGEDDIAKDLHPGAQVFRACRACHGLGPLDTNRAGPTLYGVMNRKVGSLAGYPFSDALRRRDIVWSKATIAKLFEVGPNAYLPGTKMPEQTISNAEDRQALVEWLAEKTAPTR